MSNQTTRTAAFSAAGIAALLVAAFALLTGGERAATLGLTRHGQLVTVQDAGAADAVATVAVSPGTAGQVLTVSDAGLPHWAAAASSGGGPTVTHASDCTAEPGSESASVTGTGSSSTFTLTAGTSARAYGFGGATAARIVCPVPAGARVVEVELGPITTATGLATGGYRYLTIAMRNALDGAAPATLYGASFNDSGGSTGVYFPNLMGGGNGGAVTTSVTYPPTATDRWLRVTVRPREPLLGIASGLGVSSARPTSWRPVETVGMVAPYGAYAIADTGSGSAIAVVLQSFGGSGTSTLTAGLTVRVSSW